MSLLGRRLLGSSRYSSHGTLAFVVVGARNHGVLAQPPRSRLLSFSSSSSSSSDIVRLHPDVIPTMSQVVIHNEIVYISGQIDATAIGKEQQQQEQHGIVPQTKNILAKIDDLLAEAGTDKSRLLTSNLWIKNIERDFETVNELWLDWIDPNHKPVRATVESNLAFPELLVEVQVTAALLPTPK